MTIGRPATTYTPELSLHLSWAVDRMARQADVKAAVEANHDDNRWWPLGVTDWRLRMAVAGWSTRVSYSMITSYAQVVADAHGLGFDNLRAHSDVELATLVAPLGLANARVKYFRSLCDFLDTLPAAGVDPLAGDVDEFVQRFAGQVAQASYKVAQCATLYARGYHCGIVPVDSGMIDKLAPLLGLSFSRGPVAHEEMRQVLQACAIDQADHYRQLTASLGYQVTVPTDRAPTWWLHLVLIYFKRLYCNRPHPRLCPNRPACDGLLDCGCSTKSADGA